MASDLPTNDPVRSSIVKHFHELLKIVMQSFRLRTKASVHKKRNLILQNKRRKLRSKFIVAADDLIHKLFVEFPSKTNMDLRSSMNEDESKEGRYLCVSNGHVICCLDLNKGLGQSLTNPRDVPPFPKITTLKLLEEGLPVSVGLFKSGSHAYMIGGQHLPPSSKKRICKQHFLEGASRVTYRLSLKDDATTTTTTLSPCQSNTIGKLNKPKFWPIVEKIKGQIHVFDSFPCSSYHTPRRCVWRFSHEVLKSGGCIWFEIPTADEEICIKSHTVVGNRIYAVGGGMYFVFHSNTDKWRARPGEGWLCPSPPEKLWHVLDLGFARCVGEFPFPIPLGGEAKVREPLYVVIALVRVRVNYEDRVSAVAYLVTSGGRVVCVQRVPRFYEKLVQPVYMGAGTIIDVDEEGTMCSIVNGGAILQGKVCDTACDYLFINTFGVEMLTDAAPKIQQIWGKGRKAWPVENKFVGVDMKARFIYKIDAKLDKEADLPCFADGMKAFFLVD